MTKLPLEIFRTYDIRGIYPDQLNIENALLIARALGTYFADRNVKHVVVGMDDRESSPPLTDKIIKGLNMSGIDVTFTGIVTQPATLFFSFMDGVDAVINVTASHNPAQYNGIKIEYARSEPFLEKEYKQLYELANRRDFVDGHGKYFEKDLNSKYHQDIVSRIKISKPLKVVIDCGNGSTSETAHQIFSKLGVEVVFVNCKFDSRFPRGVPDPENEVFINEISEEVKKNKADLGIGFDGDGDRIGVIDEKGNHYDTDRLLMLFVKDVLKDNPGAKILYDIKSTYLLEQVIKESGGVPEMMRTGRTFFLQKSLDKEAILGAEFSGHFFFSDKYYGFDDAIYTACRLLELLDKENTSLSELNSRYPKTYATPELQIPCPDEHKYTVVKRIVEEATNEFELKERITLDGIRAVFDDNSWFLVRAKNTSPFLTLRAEADTEKSLAAVLDNAMKILSRHKELELSALL